jgi:hypothetical protein
MHTAVLVWRRAAAGARHMGKRVAGRDKRFKGTADAAYLFQRQKQ